MQSNQKSAYAINCKMQTKYKRFLKTSAIHWKMQANPIKDNYANRPKRLDNLERQSHSD